MSGDDADDLLSQLPIGEYYTCTSVLQNVETGYKYTKCKSSQP